MNVDNIKELIEVLKLSESYDQTKWLTLNDSESYYYPACIGGHVFWLMRKNGYVYFDEQKEKYLHINGNSIVSADVFQDILMEYLEIDKEQIVLFHSEPFGEETPATKEDAIAVLENLIETGEVVWKKTNEYRQHQENY